MGYGAWLHGEAVGAGMVMAAELSAHTCGLPGSALERVRSLVAASGLPVTGPNIPPERLLQYMESDKKVAGGSLRFVVLEQIGRAKLAGGIPNELVTEAISAASARARSAAKPL
jgi:3-dehydroquinate synthase